MSVITRALETDQERRIRLRYTAAQLDGLFFRLTRPVRMTRAIFHHTERK